MILTKKEWKELLRMGRFLQPIREFVNCVVKTQDNERYAPTGADQTVETASTPSAEASILNAIAMPTGTTYAWLVAPDTGTTGDVTATVVVTFPDGSTTNVEVTITVE